MASLGALDELARDDERVVHAFAKAAGDPSVEVRKTAVGLLLPKYDFVVPVFVAALDDPVRRFA